MVTEQYKFKPKKCICGFNLTGKSPLRVRQTEDGPVGLCPQCMRDIPLSMPKQPKEPVEE